jgi:hypothetical protein
METEGQPSQHSAEVVSLNSKDLSVPKIERIVVSHQRVSKADWKNRAFINLNALGTQFEDCDFRYSVFDNAYFRDAKFTNCRFTGARFTNCNFKSANFYKCDLKFVLFQRCHLELDDLIASLPAEPNIRKEALQNLRANATEIGDYASQSSLVLQEIEATKRHYSYALRGYDSYYRNKYPGPLSKLKAAARLAWLYIGGAIWGHGEKPSRLLISSIVLLCLLTLINFWNVMPKVGWIESNAGLRPLEYVVQLFLDMNPEAKFRGYLMVDYLIVVMRYVYIGLFVAVLYKSISHR